MIPSYAALLSAYHAAFSKELQAMLESLPICSGDHVLDAGCGDGDYSLWLAPLVAPQGQIVGIDSSADYLRMARRKSNNTTHWKRIRFEKADIEHLPFPNDVFDLVWCAQSLYSFNDAPRALTEMARVTRRGGCVAILEDDTLHQILLPWPAAAELALRTAEWKAFKREKPDPDRFYVGRNLRYLMLEAGLQPQRRRTHVLHREYPVEAQAMRYLDCYFQTLRERVVSHLSRSDRRKWLPLITLGNSAYLPKQPHFSATCLDHTLWGRKP